MGLAGWFTEELCSALEAARLAAGTELSPQTDTVHLLQALTAASYPHAERVLARIGLTRKDLQALLPLVDTEAANLRTPPYSPKTKAVLEGAMHLMAAREESLMGTGHLLLALFLSDHPCLRGLSNLPRNQPDALKLLRDNGVLLGGEKPPPDVHVSDFGRPVNAYLLPNEAVRCINYAEEPNDTNPSA